jgi:hypothetical protein
MTNQGAEGIMMNDPIVIVPSICYASVSRSRDEMARYLLIKSGVIQ